MRKFEELDKRIASEVEADTLSRWGGVKAIYDETLELHKDDEKFVFYDGPATANGYPGLHHMLAKFLKDVFCKYKTMKGYKVLRKVGWDTHGLPVEVQVEKELGFSGKNDIYLRELLLNHLGKSFRYSHIDIFLFGSSSKSTGVHSAVSGVYHHGEGLFLAFLCLHRNGCRQQQDKQ